MAEECTLYKHSGAYYTAAGWQDYAANRSSPPSDPTVVSATREKVSVSLMDPNAGTLYYNSFGNANVLQNSRTEGGTRVTRKANDGATSLLEYYLYFVNGSCVVVHGAHPAHPGFSVWYTGPGGSVNFASANAGRYSMNGMFTHEEGVYETRASGLKTGTEYDADKIVYYNSNNQIFFGATASRGKRFAVHAGYYWFALLSSSDVTPDPTPNSNTRTVADGKKRALIADIEGYNAQTASATTKASTGSVTFGYWRVMHQDLGDYETTLASRVLTAVTTTDAATGTAIVLRAVWTGAGRTGKRYAIGDNIGDIVTRRPSLTVYDSRFALYAEWVHRAAILFDAQGGTQSTEVAYFAVEEQCVYANDSLTERLERISPPTKPCGVFLGYFTDPSAGVLAVNATGEFANGFAPAADTTVYARWKDVVDIELDKQGGAGGSSKIAFDSELSGFIIDGGDETRTAISVPTRPQFCFLGYYTHDDRQCITASGEMTEYFLGLSADALPSILYARWQRVSYRLDLVKADGSEHVISIFCNGADEIFYADPELTTDIDAIEIPERAGYEFIGWFDESGKLVIPPDGSLASLQPFADDDHILTERLEANVYTISFDLRGGTCASGVSTSPIAVTYGQPIGPLPTPTPPASAGTAAMFKGWSINNLIVDADTVWLFGNATLVAEYYTSFDSIEDWFGLEGDLLACVSSNDGAECKTVETSHTGKLGIGAFDSYDGAHRVGGVILNPTCTYRVIGRGSVLLTLGKLVRGKSNYGSGYMLTRWKYDTAADGIPTLTVFGTGNEGADAINLYNFTLSVDPDHIAQDPCAAIKANGECIKIVTEGVCDPVIVYENLMPCASDVTHGKIRVNASVYSYADKRQPSAISEFTEIQIAASKEDCDFDLHTIQVERSL